MKKIVKTGIALTMVLAVLALAACPGDDPADLSNTAVLSALTIGGAPVELGDGGDDPIFLTSLGVGELKSTEASIGSIITAVARDRGRVSFYIGTRNTFNINESEWILAQANNSITLTAAIPTGASQALYVRVVSESGASTWFYKVNLTVASGAASLTTLTVATVGATPAVTAPAAAATLGTPQTELSAISIDDRGAVALDSRFYNAASVNLGGNFSANATRTFIVTSTATYPPTNAVWGDGQEVSITGTDYIWVRVVSQDETATLFYCFEIQTKGYSTALTGVTIDGVAVTSIGNGGNAVNVAAANRGAAAITDDNGAIGKIVIATPEDSAAVVSYAMAAANATTATWGNDFGGAANPTSGTLTAAITNNRHLFIRVVPENGWSPTWFYRIPVTVTTP